MFSENASKGFDTVLCLEGLVIIWGYCFDLNV